MDTDSKRNIESNVVALGVKLITIGSSIGKHGAEDESTAAIENVISGLRNINTRLRAELRGDEDE